MRQQRGNNGQEVKLYLRVRAAEFSFPNQLCMLAIASPTPDLDGLRVGIRASKFAVGLIVLREGMLVESSPPATTRLGLDATHRSVDLAALTTNPDSVRHAFSLIAQGVFDACRLRTRLATPAADEGLLLSLRAVGAEGEKPYAIAVFGTVDHDEDRDPADLLAGLEEAAQGAQAINHASADHRGRLAELEQRLRRIANEIEAAGVYGYERIDPDTQSFPGLEDLTERQREILVRLLRGDRVPTISRGMHLATSTVRNHLTTVYRKVGVHSQAELIERLHSRTDS